MDNEEGKIIAVITARGGSKRIPNKNIKDFCGKPIIFYSINAAQESGIFDEVIVSTDSKKIAEIAITFGASVPFMRSEKTSNDYATTSDVLLEVCDEYERLRGKLKSICCIYPTAPFITAKKIHEAMYLLHETNADSVIPVVKFDFPPQRGLIEENGRIKFWFPEHERARTQDLTPLYHDCGQFYCISTEALKKYHSLITPNSKAVIFPVSEVQDIDNLSDWELAENKFKLYKENRSVPLI